MFLTACNPSNHLSRFRSPEFAPKMLSKLSFIIPNAASIIPDQEKGIKRWKTQKTTPNHRDADSHRGWYYHMTSVFGEIWSVIFTLQITDMADSHRIKITDDLHNSYRLLEVSRLNWSRVNRAEETGSTRRCVSFTLRLDCEDSWKHLGWCQYTTQLKIEERFGSFRQYCVLYSISIRFIVLMQHCFHSPLISLRQASTAAVWRCNKITSRSSSLYRVCDLSGEMSPDWSCGTNTSLMRLQTSWGDVKCRVGGVRSVRFWCEILLRLLLHVGPHSRSDWEWWKDEL